MFEVFFDFSALRDDEKKEVVKKALREIQKTEVGKELLGSLAKDQKIKICEVLPETKYNSTTPDHTLHLIFEKTKKGYDISTHLLLHELVHERQHQNGLQTRQIDRFDEVVLHEVLGECEAKAYEIAYEKTKGIEKCRKSLVFSILNLKKEEGEIPDISSVLSLYASLPNSSEKQARILDCYAESQINEHLESRFYLGPKKSNSSEKICDYYDKTLGVSKELVKALKNWIVESIANQGINKKTYPKSFLGQLEQQLESEMPTHLIPIVFKTETEDRIIFVSEDKEGNLSLYDKDKQKLTADEKGQCFKDKNGNQVCSFFGNGVDKQLTTIYGTNGKKMIEWGINPFGVESKHILGEKIRIAGGEVELQINSKGMHCKRDKEIKTINANATYQNEEMVEVFLKSLKQTKSR